MIWVGFVSSEPSVSTVKLWGCSSFYWKSSDPQFKSGPPLRKKLIVSDSIKIYAIIY